MWISLGFLFVITVFQAYGASISQPHHLMYKRSPQRIDIQSIRQKQISPDITVVDVVVNEPTRGRYPTQNSFNIPVYQQRPTNTIFYPSNQMQQIRNQRPAEIQIIEVIDTGTRNGIQTWQRYPQQQAHQYPHMYPVNPTQQIIPLQPQRPNRRPYRPNPDFHIEETEPESPRERLRPKPQPLNEPDESSDEEKYVFDAEEQTITGYTKDNFPIIPLRKSDIR